MEILSIVICCFSVVAALWALLWETELLGFFFGFYYPEQKITTNLSPEKILEKLKLSDFGYNVIVSQDGMGFYVIVNNIKNKLYLKIVSDDCYIPYFQKEILEINLISYKISSLKRRKIKKQEKFLRDVTNIFI